MLGNWVVRLFSLVLVQEAVGHSSVLNSVHLEVEVVYIFSSYKG